jgi:polynucleotide 5'-kinase involved in rRNA processing
LILTSTHGVHPMLAELEYSASVILDTALARERRVLLLGDVGVGKSTLAASLARVLWQAGRHAWCIDADPGMPSFGIPGAVCRGEWCGDSWRTLDLEALCSLDAGRFRLPLVAAVARLAENRSPGTLLVDAPGVVRGVAGAELFAGLVEAARVDLILVLARPGPPPLRAGFKATGIETLFVQASPAACRSNKRQRARRRTRLWDDYLHNSKERQIVLSEVELIGTPPPSELDNAWIGRQIALLSGTHTLGLGEVLAKDADSLRLRMPAVQRKPDSLLVRDAQRGADALLTTAKAFGSAALRYIPPPDVNP